MKLIHALVASLVAMLVMTKATTYANELEEDSRELRNGRGKKRVLKLNVVNEAFQQPFGAFFVMVHKSSVPPLYVRGKPASPQLARLAEDGNPKPLVKLYKKMDGVLRAFAFNTGAPYFLGDEPATIKVVVPDGYLVTIASMAINTNDCFVAINGEKLHPGQVLDLPGLDSGSEENNERCDSIPGPACEDPTNNRDGNGEGYVHVHRGFHGIFEDLTAVGYDWRNPMLRVIVE